MPRAHFVTTLAHELMHVWLFRNAPIEMDDLLCEGSCNYASYLVLKQWQQDDVAYELHTLQDDPDEVYGEGYRRVAEYVSRQGVAQWLEYLRENEQGPWDR